MREYSKTKLMEYLLLTRRFPIRYQFYMANADPSTYLRFLAHEIRKYNSFGCPVPSSATKQIVGELSQNSSGNGVWIMPSFINHACPGAGSARRSFIGDMMVVRAARDIKKGEQITHAYNLTTEFDTRRANLLKIWGFVCDCSLCAAELLETSAIRNKRQTQLATILKLNGQSTNFLKKGIQLVRLLESTYTKPATEQPRHVVFEAFRHLAIMEKGTTLDEILVTLHGALEALGYKIGESQGKVFITRHGSIATSLPEIFHQCSIAYSIFGDVSMAESYNEIAASFYEVIFGERKSFIDEHKSYFADRRIFP